ncbi:MAG TPA: dTDP-4-dehydrorhamnose 3,5-epimerase [Gemmatimonadaceae bacterium]|nr:dTDP-4-dehydrorhamnose 3,5-epimerase [Gemmatimonadaceae bacterium]
MSSAPVVAESTGLPGVLLLNLKTFSDSRGVVVETFNERTFADAGVSGDFVQDNHSRSRRGVLRGLHFQKKAPQGKLIRAIRGAIFDVAVDVRVGSPTFAQWIGVTLTADSAQALWVPPGFAHGFCTLSEEADVLYKCTGFYDPTDESGVVWNDTTVGIKWPVDDPVLSIRDAALPPLTDREDLPRYV